MDEDFLAELEATPPAIVIDLPDLSARARAHNAAMNRVAALGPFPTNWALVATDDEYELLAARLGVLS